MPMFSQPYPYPPGVEEYLMAMPPQPTGGPTGFLPTTTETISSAQDVLGPGFQHFTQQVPAPDFGPQGGQGGSDTTDRLLDFWNRMSPPAAYEQPQSITERLGYTPGGPWAGGGYSGPAGIGGTYDGSLGDLFGNSYGVIENLPLWTRLLPGGNLSAGAIGLNNARRTNQARNDWAEFSGNADSAENLGLSDYIGALFGGRYGDASTAYTNIDPFGAAPEAGEGNRGNQNRIDFLRQMFDPSARSVTDAGPATTFQGGFDPYAQTAPDLRPPPNPTGAGRVPVRTFSLPPPSPTAVVNAARQQAVERAELVQAAKAEAAQMAAARAAQASGGGSWSGPSVTVPSVVAPSIVSVPTFGHGGRSGPA